MEVHAVKENPVQVEDNRFHTHPHSGEIRSGEVTIDESTYTARLKGNVLDLTFKEFELLKYLAQHPGRVFTRAQLLQEIWGYDYFGGTRTVDVVRKWKMLGISGLTFPTRSMPSRSPDPCCSSGRCRGDR